MTTYILGAGPTGMAIADGLGDAQTGPFVVIEKSHSLGGLAQTIEWERKGAHDLGPHKIFSLDEKLVRRVEALLPGAQWLTQKKVSTIYMNGHYLPYPPSPFSLAQVFGLYAFAKIILGYGFAKISSLLATSEAKTFEADLEERLGSPLYEVLFKPIAIKLWGDPKELDIKLSKGRVQTPSLHEVVFRLLKIKQQSNFEALTFRYPKGGIGMLWKAIQHKAQHQGHFQMGATVIGLEATQGRVTRIKYLHAGEQCSIEVGPKDNVVSTLPLSLTVNLLGNSLPKELPALVDDTVALNDLLLVFFHIDLPSLLDESWVFIPDPDIVFHRLSEQESFDPAMTPNGSIICCEIMSHKNRHLAELSDVELTDKAYAGLQQMGYRNFNVLARRVIRLPKSYPVFRVGYESKLEKIVTELDRLKNFRSIGRQGAFNYIGTLDAMDIGYGFVNWLAKQDDEAWCTERTRTNHYPVLD